MCSAQAVIGTQYKLAASAVVITVNWGGYIWGVNNERVVETSLGYFINPLVTVLMGVLILGEHLRRLQWVAMAIAFVAVVVLKPGATVTEQELKAHARSRLAPFKVPKAFAFVSTLPKNPSGKLLRRFLRDRAKELTASGKIVLPVRSKL